MQFAAGLVQCNVAPKSMLTTRLDVYLLDGAGLLPRNAKVFNSQHIKASTKRKYTQVKFNLLREESEGFSKL